MKIENTAIIGAGPTGIAAGIQLKRYGISPIIFEKDKPGGLLRNANLVENYPGFPGGIAGTELASSFVKQLNKESIEVISENVTDISFDRELFIIKASEKTYNFRKLLIASGTKPIEFTDFKIQENVKDRILYEIYPILNETNKNIIIVGAGDAAFDYALNLGRNNKIVILNRGKKVKCLPLLEDRAAKLPAISIHNNTTITNIAENSRGMLRVKCTNCESTMNFDVHYLVFAIGRRPQFDFLSESVMSRRQELENRELLFFAGDVKNGYYRQTSIAVGDGVMAAMKIYEKLKEII